MSNWQVIQDASQEDHFFLPHPDYWGDLQCWRVERDWEHKTQAWNSSKNATNCFLVLPTNQFVESFRPPMSHWEHLTCRTSKLSRRNCQHFVHFIPATYFCPANQHILIVNGKWKPIADRYQASPESQLNSMELEEGLQTWAFQGTTLREAKRRLSVVSMALWDYGKAYDLKNFPRGNKKSRVGITIEKIWESLKILRLVKLYLKANQ